MCRTICSTVSETQRIVWWNQTLHISVYFHRAPQVWLSDMAIYLDCSLLPKLICTCTSNPGTSSHHNSSPHHIIQIFGSRQQTKQRGTCAAVLHRRKRNLMRPPISEEGSGAKSESSQRASGQLSNATKPHNGTLSSSTSSNYCWSWSHVPTYYLYVMFFARLTRLETIIETLDTNAE